VNDHALCGFVPVFIVDGEHQGDQCLRLEARCPAAGGEWRIAGCRAVGRGLAVVVPNERGAAIGSPAFCSSAAWWNSHKTSEVLRLDGEFGALFGGD
jgi:hypothetical protein